MYLDDFISLPIKSAFHLRQANHDKTPEFILSLTMASLVLMRQRTCGD